MLSDYTKFQAKLYPVLPFLIYQANKIRKENPSPPAISENLILGNGKRKILILGESTVAGVGASQEEFTLAGNLYRLIGSDFQVTNLGKNGLRASQALPHFNATLRSISESFEGACIFLGANDCFRLTHPKKYHQSLSDLLQFLQNKLKVKWIYLADIPPVQLFPAFPNLLEFFLKAQRTFLQKEMKSIALESEHILFEPILIDISYDYNLSFSCHMESSHGLQSSHGMTVSSCSISPDFFSKDNIHPSDMGYQKIAEFAAEGLLRSDFINRDQGF